MENAMVTPKDVLEAKFTSKTAILGTKGWYDADEVDELLDEYVAPTIQALGSEAIEKLKDGNVKDHYVVVDDGGNVVFETDSHEELDERIGALRRFKEKLSRLIPKDLLKSAGPYPDMSVE